MYTRHAGLLVAVAAVGLGVAFAASALPRVTEPPMSICAGSHLWVGHRYEGSLDPRQPFTVTVFGPSGRRVWQKVWEPGERIRYWPHELRPQKPGRYRVVYENSRRRSEFGVLVVRCEQPVELRLNDEGKAMLSLRNAKPGTSTQSCIMVTYAGERTADVRLYGRTSSTGLDRYLRLTVVRGRMHNPSFGSCLGFEPDRGSRRGLVYRGTLLDFPDGYAAGLRERRWRSGESRVYRFTVTLLNSNKAQGGHARQEFVWNARAASAAPLPLPKR